MSPKILSASLPKTVFSATVDVLGVLFHLIFLRNEAVTLLSWLQWGVHSITVGPVQRRTLVKMSTTGSSVDVFTSPGDSTFSYGRHYIFIVIGLGRVPLNYHRSWVLVYLIMSNTHGDPSEWKAWLGQPHFGLVLIIHGATYQSDCPRAPFGSGVFFRNKYMYA